MLLYRGMRVYRHAKQTVVGVWRSARSLKLHWMLLVMVVMLLLNVMFSDRQTHVVTSHDVKGPWRTFKGHLPDSAPLVGGELSSGVQEEENSAREVLDGEGVEARQEHAPEVDAANEVNSVEADPSGKGRGDVTNWRNLTKEEVSRLSVLGRRLFLGEQVGVVQRNKTFTILVWQHGPRLERRFLREFGNVTMDPFRKCSARNCRLTYENNAAADADAIMIHLHLTKGPHTFPNRTRQDQRWIWLTDESAAHTFMLAKERHMYAYNGYFNWSMSYRMDSDVPVPYGRTLPLTPDEAAAYQPFNYFAFKPRLVAAMGSNCGGSNKRWPYIRELKKHVEVDAYGGCGNLKCKGHFTKDCPILAEYKFYLAFENTNCREYITEKVWWNALSKGSVPVVMGTKKEDYRKTLPPNSFIHIDDFQSPKSLAEYLIYLGTNEAAYNQYHEWRARYRVVNEHGYFQTPVYHYCRICEALNYNSPNTKIYNDLEDYWGKSKYCYSHTWEERLKSNSTVSNSG